MCILRSDSTTAITLFLTLFVQYAKVNHAQAEFTPKPVYGSFDKPDELPQAPSDLRYAFVIFRHGIRSPIYSPFQTQNQFVSMWPDGLGELTADGKRLMFNVGQSLRSRYRKLVPDYNEEVVQFTSTHSSRATMSAYCVAAGAFPVQEPVFVKEGISNWKRIPVSQDALYDKHKLFSQKKEQSQCLTFTAMREQMKKLEKSTAPETRKEYYKELNSCILTAYGKPDFADTFQGNSKAYDTFQAWMLNDQKVPAWIVHMFPVMEKMKQLRMWAHIHSKPGMMQFFTGPLFSKVQSEMEAVASGSDRRAKLHFHGSHDITLCATIWATSGAETYLALPGDTILVEMSDDAVVKMYLYVPLDVDENNRFRNISLKHLCGKDDCTLSEFKEKLKEFTFDEKTWKTRCDANLKPDDKFREYPWDIDENDLKIMREAKSLLQGITSE